MTLMLTILIITNQLYIEKTGLEFKKQHQGVDNFGKYFEEEQEIGKFMFKKFREALKKQ